MTQTIFTIEVLHTDRGHDDYTHRLHSIYSSAQLAVNSARELLEKGEIVEYIVRRIFTDSKEHPLLIWDEREQILILNTLKSSTPNTGWEESLMEPTDRPRSGEHPAKLHFFNILVTLEVMVTLEKNDPQFAEYLAENDISRVLKEHYQQWFHIRRTQTTHHRIGSKAAEGDRP